MRPYGNSKLRDTPPIYTVQTTNRNSVPPRYDNSEVLPSPEDVNLPGIAEEDYAPREGESIPDTLRRIGGPALAVKRMIEALSACHPNGTPDPRTRLEAAVKLRDTVEGTPDKRPAPKAKDADGKPAPGILISEKGKSPDSQNKQ